jgi:hypothetical protein
MYIAHVHRVETSLGRNDFHRLRWLSKRLGHATLHGSISDSLFWNDHKVDWLSGWHHHVLIVLDMLGWNPEQGWDSATVIGIRTPNCASFGDSIDLGSKVAVAEIWDGYVEELRRERLVDTWW